MLKIRWIREFIWFEIVFQSVCLWRVSHGIGMWSYGFACDFFLPFHLLCLVWKLLNFDLFVGEYGGACGFVWEEAEVASWSVWEDTRVACWSLQQSPPGYFLFLLKLQFVALLCCIVVKWVSLGSVPGFYGCSSMQLLWMELNSCFGSYGQIVPQGTPLLNYFLVWFFPHLYRFLVSLC